MNKIKKLLKNYHPNKYLLFTYLLLPILFFAFNPHLGLDNDRWFILNTGRYILNHGIPYIEPFTLHAGLSYISQQWLFGIILYLTYQYLGNLGLIFLTFISIIITEYLFYKLCNLLNDNRKSLSTILTVGFMLLYILNYASTRPQLFDFIIFLLEFYILEKYIKNNNSKILFALPLLSIFLINNHASVYFMFCAFMLPYVLNVKSKYFEYQKYRIMPIIIAMIVSMTASLLNPYLLDAHKYLFNSYGNKIINYSVVEMRNPFFNVNSIGTIMIIITIAIPNLIVIFTKKDIKLRYFLLYLGTTYLAITSYKGYQYYLLSAIFPLADYLKEKFLVTKEINLLPKTKLTCYALYISIFVFFLIVFYNNYSQEKYKNEYPVINLVAKMDELVANRKLNKSNLKIYTNYNIGAYVEWMGYKAYMDARAEVFLKKNNHKEDIFEEYYELFYTNTPIEEFISKYDFDYILANNAERIYTDYLNTVNNQNYKYITEEKNDKDTYILYEKNT